MILIQLYIFISLPQSPVARAYKILYNGATMTKLPPPKPPEMPTRKRLLFRASSLDDLRAFPALARQTAGFELNNVEEGREPADWKHMPTIGAGAIELRIWDEGGTFRVIYVAKFESAIYVLHCFQKKTQRTSKADIDLAAARYKDLVKELKHGK